MFAKYGTEKNNQYYTKDDLKGSDKILVLFNKDRTKPLNIADINSGASVDIYRVRDSFVHNRAFYSAEVMNSGGLKIFDTQDLNDIAILELEKNVNNQEIIPAC